jgi:hypothetical protein
LIASLSAAETSELIGVLGQASIETSEAAMAQTLTKARSLDEVLRNAGWQVFEAVAALKDHRKQAAAAIRARVAEILAADEHAIALKPALDEQHGKALRLLTDIAPPPVRTEPIVPPSPKQSAESVVIREAQASDLEPRQAKRMLKEIDQALDKDGDLRLSISWRLTKRKS